jgi:hypothetical protein
VSSDLTATLLHSGASLWVWLLSFLLTLPVLLFLHFLTQPFKEKHNETVAKNHSREHGNRGHKH